MRTTFEFWDLLVHKKP